MRTIAQSVANKYKMQKIIAIKATKCSQKAYKLWVVGGGWKGIESSAEGKRI